MDKKALAARQKFIDSFSARVNDSVISMEMAELRASDDSLKKMELKLQSRAEGIWGMIVICQKSVYFFAPEHELTLLSTIRLSSEDSKIEEQIFCFNDLQELKFFLPQKKWFQIFGQDRIAFSFLLDGRRVEGEFFISKKPVDILLKVREALSL